MTVSRTDDQLVVLNHFLRKDSDGWLWPWGPGSSKPGRAKFHPSVIDFVTNVASKPCALSKLREHLVRTFRIEPGQATLTCEKLMGAFVLITPEVLRHGYELLRGRDRLLLDHFLRNLHSIEYARAAVRLGLTFEAKTPYTITIKGNGHKHTVVAANRVTFEDGDAQNLSKQKDSCTAIWREMGLPVPRETVLPIEKLMDAPGHIGYPMVLKPVDSGAGLGVFPNIRTEEGLRLIVDHYLEDTSLQSKDFVVQEFVVGIDHRMLMIGDRVAAVCQRRLPTVVGDGCSTIKELIARKESRVNKKFSFQEPSVRLNLEQLGLNENSVIPDREKVVISHRALTSAGAYIVDVTDTIHPSICEAALRAKKAIGLKIAGLDFLTPDSTKPIEEAGGAFLEINGAVGTALQTWPDEGKPCWMADEMVRYMFELE